MTLSPGIRLGPYEIVGPLGAGGMGEVYRARDTKLSREVAIKSLPAAFAEDAGRLARFRREAQTLASLNHSNIAAIYGLEEAGGAPYLVLELVEGETLAARLERGALPAREALEICTQIAAAIEAAHERGVVHRDLKPGNVMIAATGAVKVLDFGLAKTDEIATVSGELSMSPTVTAHARATEVGTILGTAAYMSPEQARGKAVDRRSDVWSFGCVLYECFAGRAAFAGETVSDLIARILEREPDWASLPAGTPPRVRDMLRRCLRKDAKDRPRDMRDVRLELAEIGAAGARTEDAAREKSIAVLPFNNLSGAEDEYFADGVTEEILNALAHLEGLRVAARSSCFAFKGKREDLRSVGEKLDVATVLEGSVRRAGDRLRITAQLVNAADGYQLWSERYDREMTDVFAVQDEIANAIATKLRGSFAGEAERAKGRRGTTSLEAYELFLKGRVRLIQRGRFIREAIGLFEQAIALDPDYADALASLADGYRLLGTFGVRAYAEMAPKARSAAARALALDPENADAFATLASVAAQFDRDYAAAATSWDRALAIDPRHTRARCERALFVHGFGVWPAEKGAEETAVAVAHDPLNAWAAGMHCFLLGFSRRYDEAIAESERAVQLDPASFFAQWQRLRAFTWAGNHERAMELGPELLEYSGRHHWVLGTLSRTYAMSGHADRARAIYDELEARSRLEFLVPFWLAAAASWAGLHEEAVRHAVRAFAERDPLVLLSAALPEWERLREDARVAERVRGVEARAK